MNRSILFAGTIAATLMLSACQPGSDADDSDGAVSQAEAALVAPTGTDDNAWKTYLGQVIGRNMEGITERTFNYYLPADTDPQEEGGAFSRMQGDVNGVVLRTVLPGNMLTFSSPNSALMADLIVGAFQGVGVQDSALRGSRVLFIGKAEDEARVRAAVEAVGGEFRFVEAK